MKASVLVKVGGDRDQVDILPVVADDLNYVCTLLERLGHLDDKRSVTSLVGSYLLAVDLDSGSLGRTFKEQEMIMLDIVYPECTPVSRLTPEILRRMAVYSIVRMRYSDALP